MSLPPYRYRLKYRPDIQVGSFDKADVGDDEGLTDALLIASVLKTPGGVSTMFWTFDGTKPTTDLPGKQRVAEMDPDDLFGLWLILANSLAANELLSTGKRAVAGYAFESIADAIRRGRGLK